MSQLPQASLARSSLIKMGVPIAIVIALATLASYLHISRLVRDSTLSHLAQHVAERVQREQFVLLLAQDNQAVLNKELEERIRAWRQQDRVTEHLPGAYNLIFRDDGQLLAHPEMRVESGKPAYNILGTGESGSTVGTAAQRAHLRAIFERVKGRSPEQTVLELPEHGEYLAVARLSGPDWNFVTVLPEREVSSAALSAARYVLVFGLASLLLELVIVFWVLRELEQRIDTRTRELKDVQSKLVEAARRAGMAEVATNVLHNVGNVLNSVSTSAMLAKERLAGLRLEHVARVAGLLEENRPRLGPFLTEDERGRKILPFLSQLGNHMKEEHRELRELLDDVRRYTEHIGTIVKLQQGYARHSRVKEPVALEGLLDEAVRINEAALARHKVVVVRALEPLPPVVTERHKVLMILINLISNAKYAMDAVPENKRCLTLKVARAQGERIHLEVSDTGMGIAPELLTRIFQYGFSTREQGHGFGLHSSALAARELGGTLTVHSAGPGQGASFVLELPLHSTQGAS